MNAAGLWAGLFTWNVTNLLLFLMKKCWNSLTSKDFRAAADTIVQFNLMKYLCVCVCVYIYKISAMILNLRWIWLRYLYTSIDIEWGYYFLGFPNYYDFIQNSYLMETIYNFGLLWDCIMSIKSWMRVIIPLWLLYLSDLHLFGHYFRLFPKFSVFLIMFLFYQ